MSEEIARRLVTIAAVDAVGFSRQSEIDETAAVRQIQALHERVEAGAADHSGRVFNTAGDGFMLEFPTASGALQFAETLLETARVPLRIGIHMGEVFEAAGGDLLGRGVNVAARLRELAAPGEVLVSGETKRALPTPGGDRLVSRGATRLSKMDEKVEMFSLAGSWRGHLPQTVWTERLRDKRLWIAAAVSGAVLIIGAFAIPGLMRNENERVAVLEFETASDATLTDFAAELSDQIVGALAAGDLQAIPPASSSDFRAAGLGVSARRVGAGFVLDGNVRVDGDDTRVTMHIVDARTNVTLWSGEYRRATVEQSPMQDQLAAHVADVLRCALVSRRPRAGEIDPDTLAIFLRACDRMQRFDQGPEVLYEAARQVTDRAPRFARGWSMLAMACALASTRSPPDQAEDFRRQAREAAVRAQAIDPRNAESALALAMILPPHEWRARQELIERALSNEPNSADANIFQGNFLTEVGRVQEALSYYRRAAALDPLSPVPGAAMLPTLSQLGEFSEARELRDRLHRIWPNSPSVWYNRFNNSAFMRDADEALRILDTVDQSPIRMEQPVRNAWRDYLLAMRGGDTSRMRAAAGRLAAMARTGGFDMPRAISAASLAGDVDAGFALAQDYFGADSPGLGRSPLVGGHRSFLFLAPGDAMRRDVRFMDIARVLGLTGYWIETDQWPDFCADPTLTYDCRAEARRVT